MLHPVIVSYQCTLRVAIHDPFQANTHMPGCPYLPYAWEEYAFPAVRHDPFHGTASYVVTDSQASNFFSMCYIHMKI